MKARISVLLVVLATLVLASGCGSTKTTTIIEKAPTTVSRTEWPSAAREAFTQSCRAGHGTQANCECLLHQEEARTTVNDVLTKDQQFSEALHAAVRECVRVVQEATK